MTDLTDAGLDALQTKAEAVDPKGPFDVRENGIAGRVFSRSTAWEVGSLAPSRGFALTPSQSYAHFLAAASPDCVLGLIQEIRRLREALMFYADSDTYEQVDILGDCPLSDDAESGLFGKRARQALGAP